MKLKSLIQSLGEIENVLHKNIGSDSLASEVLELSAKTLNCHSAAVTFVDGDFLEIHSIYNFDEKYLGLRIPLANEPDAVQSLNERNILLIEDVISAGTVDESPIIDSSVKSVVIVPLLTRDHKIGVIFYNFRLRKRFSKASLIFFNHISSSLALSIENARLIRDLQNELAIKSSNETKLLQLNRILVILSNCSNMMINAVSEEEYLNQICQTIIRESDLALVWIGFIRNNIIRPEFHAGSATGYLTDLYINTDHGPTSLGPTGSAIRSRQTVVCNNIEDSSFKPWAAKARAFNIRSSASIPLLVRDEPIGVINLYSFMPDFFTHEEMLLFSELGKYVGQGITTIRYEKMKMDVQASLRDSEEQFRMLAHKSNAIIFEVDPSGQILYSNEKFYQTAGTDKKLLAGFNEIVKELAMTVHNIEADYKIRDSEGINRWFSFHKSGILNPGGVIRTSYIVFDITAQKESEIKLLQQTEELRNLNATKDKFFGIIAHDMKNPFTSILGASELMIDSAESLDVSKAVKLAGIVHDSAKRGFALLQNLLDWSRSQTGLISFRPSNLNAGEAINRCIDDLSIAAEKKKLRISVRDAGELRLNADKNMFCSILRNLVHNAIKYSPENSGITISAGRENGMALFMVKDEGIGIPDENIGKLFRIDEGFTTPGTHKEQGTGLGLLLCHEFVRKHKGRIWVESSAGNGSTFYFTMPLAT